MGRPVLYTPEQATLVLPRFGVLLPELRKMREELISVQNKCDVEELTSFGTTGRAAQESRDSMDRYQASIRSLEREFEKKLHVFEELGCELKSLEPGLVDFYSEKEGELIYLCWQEGEESVSFWHPISTGFAGRQPIL